MDRLGVVYYTLDGDGPQARLAGKRRHRVGFPGDTATVAALLQVIVKDHTIPLNEFKLDVIRVNVSKRTTEVAQPGDVVKSYADELRITVSRKQLEDIQKEELAALKLQEKEAADTMLSSIQQIDTDSSHGLPQAAVASGRSAPIVAPVNPTESNKKRPRDDEGDTQFLEKVAKINAKSLPLAGGKKKGANSSASLLAGNVVSEDNGLIPLPSIDVTDQLEGSSDDICVLCDMAVYHSFVTPCCSKVTCRACHTFAESLVASGTCPVCGVGLKAAPPPEVVVANNTEKAIVKQEAVRVVMPLQPQALRPMCALEHLSKDAVWGNIFANFPMASLLFAD